MFLNVILSQKSKFTNDFDIADEVWDNIKAGQIEQIVSYFDKEELFKKNKLEFERLSKETVLFNSDNSYVSQSNEVVDTVLNKHTIKVVLTNRKDNTPIVGLNLEFNNKANSKVTGVIFLLKRNLDKEKVVLPPPPPSKN